MNYRFASEEDHENGKYAFGDELIKMDDIKDLSLVVAFDYLSIENSDYCFNNDKISIEDYRKLFEFKKEISKIKIKNFIDDTRIKRLYHFHSVDLYQKKFLINMMKKLLNYNKFIEAFQLPTIYQIALYTDNNQMKAPRILGFFGKNATFHILWFDYEHKIYGNIK